MLLQKEREKENQGRAFEPGEWSCVCILDSSWGWCWEWSGGGMSGEQLISRHPGEQDGGTGPAS